MSVSSRRGMSQNLTQRGLDLCAYLSAVYPRTSIGLRVVGAGGPTGVTVDQSEIDGAMISL